MRTRVRATVDLPEPDSPASPRVSPGAIVNETPSTALTTWLPTSPRCTVKCTRRSRTSTAGRAVAGGEAVGEAVGVVAAAGEAAWRSVVAPWR